MKGKGRYQIWLTLGIFCVFVILPCAGYGAELEIGNTLSTTGDWVVNGTINATHFSGDGSGLTNVPGTVGHTIAVCLQAPASCQAACVKGVIVSVPSPCQVTSDTGSIMWVGSDYACCVCSP